MNNTIKELLQEIIAEAYEISNTTATDVFFSYEPHVNYYQLYYYKNGWDLENDERAKYIASAKDISEESLQKAIDELKKLREGV